MRRPLLFGFFILIVACILPGSMPQRGSFIEGAWKLVRATFTRNGARMAEFPGR